MPAERRSRAAMTHDTTEALLAAAHQSFASAGFTSTSLETLSAGAGVTRGALHHHFTNKSGLFEAVLRQIVAEVAAEVTASWYISPDPWTNFQQGFHSYLDAILRPDRRRILFQDAPAVLGMKSVDILMQSEFGAMVDDLGQMIGSGQIAATDPEALGHLLNGATINLAFWAAEGPASESRLPRAHATLQAMLTGFTR